MERGSGEQDHRTTGPQDHRGSGAQGLWGSGAQGLRGSGAQGLRGGLIEKVKLKIANCKIGGVGLELVAVDTAGWCQGRGWRAEDAR
ncbi:MAG: hypothetical protein Rhob2KO_40830 [Rhodopirellula baltica]